MKITPKDNEIEFDKNTLLVSKTDLKGSITYCNKAFMEIVNIKEKYLIGKPHNLIRHPDMPRIIFKALWDYLKAGKEINAYVKNLTSDGSYYWVFANITPSYVNDKVVGYHSARRKPSKNALEVIIPFYKQLLEAEKHGGMQESEKILTKLLENKGIEYDEFILSI